MREPEIVNLTREMPRSQGPSGAGRPRIVLEVLRGRERGRCYVVREETVNIGRGGIAAGAWVEVGDSTVSRLHAVLEWDAQQGRYWLRNASQTNPMRVNGRVIDEALLEHGDRIRLGGLVFEVRIPSSTPEVAAAENGPEVLEKGSRGKWRAPRRSEMARVFGQLGVMMEAGIPLARALDAMTRKGATEATRAACEKLRSAVRQGKRLSSAMADLPGVFTALHVHSVKAGEDSGRLPMVMAELALWEERDLSLTRAVSGSMIYPGFVLGVGALLLGGLGSRLFSTLGSVLQQSGKPLPLLTRILFGASATLQRPLVLLALFLAVIALGGTIRWWVRTRQGRACVDRLILRLPIFGSLARKLFVARFCGHLSLLFQSGIPLLQGLETSARITSNEGLRAEIDGAVIRLRHGETLAESLRGSGLFPRMVVGMVGVGEETGNLGDLLRKLAAFYDEEVYRTLETQAKLLEPAVILVLGVMVGVFVLGTLLPIYGLVAA